MKNIRGKSVKKSRDWIQEKKVRWFSFGLKNSTQQTWNAGFAGPCQEEREGCQTWFQVHWQKEKRQILKQQILRKIFYDNWCLFHTSIQIPDSCRFFPKYTVSEVQLEFPRLGLLKLWSGHPRGCWLSSSSSLKLKKCYVAWLFRPMQKKWFFSSLKLN